MRTKASAEVKVSGKRFSPSAVGRRRRHVAVDGGSNDVAQQEAGVPDEFRRC